MLFSSFYLFSNALLAHTHLDVYKRQGLMLFSSFYLFSNALLAPVSYTHLAGLMLFSSFYLFSNALLAQRGKYKLSLIHI
ncbi:hypothetical protein A5794_002232 [Enterococcus faecium]|nr:hypothetical protein A5794_002232 [Enterococcus faecium]